MFVSVEAVILSALGSPGSVSKCSKILEQLKTANEQSFYSTINHLLKVSASQEEKDRILSVLS
jgi:hypothetical protein